MLAILLTLSAPAWPAPEPLPTEAQQQGDPVTYGAVYWQVWLLANHATGEWEVIRTHGRNQFYALWSLGYSGACGPFTSSIAETGEQKALRYMRGRRAVDVPVWASYADWRCGPARLLRGAARR